MTNFNSGLGSFIRELRKAKGETLHEVAKGVDIDSPMLSKIETGGRLPTQEQLKRLCYYFNVTESKLKALYTAEKIVKEFGLNETTYEATRIISKQIANHSNDNKLYTKEEKKQNGIFYTPTFLSDYLAKKVIQYFGDISNIDTTLDPACGDGILLKSLVSELLTNGSVKHPSVFGIDKDVIAIKKSKSTFSESPFKIINSRFLNTDGLFPFEGVSSTEGWNKLKVKLKAKGGFNVILSNPPWGAEIDEKNLPKLDKNFTLAKGQFDIYNLFVESILNNLSYNGVYGLILPDSIFNQEQTAFRSMLARKTTIHLIARLGEKIFPEINRACVIIIGRNALPDKKHVVDCFRLNPHYKKQVISNELSLDNVEKELSHKVFQTRFSENDDFIFDIDLKSEEQRTFNKIQNNCIALKHYVESTRGAEISKKGIACQCPSCKLWMPFPKSKNPTCNVCNNALDVTKCVTEKIILTHNGPGNIKLKVGEDLYRYTSRSKSWINTLKEGINYKDLNIYSGDKILVRKTGIGITASIDYENAITNQVVYILKLKPEFEKTLSLEFILAVLNSRVMTYYLIKKFGENEWRSHPYLTQTLLVNLPFPIIDLTTLENKEIIANVTKFVREEVSSSNEKNISKSKDLYIERMVAKLFKMNQSDYKVIFETLNTSDQLIPIKRLLNCNTKEIFTSNGV